jgi:glycosyltransferase involved in cell wall biosynthesis
VTAVHQVLAAAAPNDAVTDQALRWAALLAREGIGGRLVAEHVHPAMRDVAVAVDRGGRALLRGAPLVLHYSIWSRAAEAALEAPGPLGLVYHNITPGELLREANPAAAEMCDRGRAELVRFRGRVQTLIAVSAFNAAELAAAGLGAAEVVPLVLDVPAEPPAGRAPTGPPTILTVGRVAPNKRLEDVLRVLTLLQRNRTPDAALVIVGSSEGFERYRAGLDELAGRLGVRNVTWAGRISDAERDALYHHAGAYLCMSVHEGFCAPLVEAMGAGTPIVARAAGAVPETMGDAGIAIPDDDPAVYAEALHAVLGSPALRERLRAGAAARLEELSPERAARRVREALRPLVAAA